MFNYSPPNLGKRFIPKVPALIVRKQVGRKFVNVNDNTDPYVGEDYHSFTLPLQIEAGVPQKPAPALNADPAHVVADAVRSKMSNLINEENNG